MQQSRASRAKHPPITILTPSLPHPLLYQVAIEFINQKTGAGIRPENYVLGETQMVAQTKKTKKELKAERRALMQDADSVINKDDLIGRVVIDLCRTHPNTVYDSWFELRRSKTIDDKGKFGAVRVRYSLEWNTPERRRLLAYISPPPLFVTHIESRNIVDGINQIVYGDTKPDVDDNKFSLDRFKSHAREFKSHMMDGVYASQQHHRSTAPSIPLTPLPSSPSHPAATL